MQMRMCRRLGQLKWCICLWVGGVVFTSSTLIGVWTHGLDGFIRYFSNLAYLITLPGWIVLYAIGFGSIRSNPIAIVCVSMLAWLIWCVLFAAALRVHARISGRQIQHPELDEIDGGRRAFLANSALGFGAVGATVSPTYATLIEPWDIKVRRYSIPVRGLPSAFEGLCMVQFSDSHLGPRIPASFIRAAVQQVVELQPDILLLTGDYIHDGTGEIDQAAELCHPMIDAAKYGSVGVLGNHDWWGDGPRMSEALKQRGVHMIDNNRVWLDPKDFRLNVLPVEDAIAFVGLGDLTEDVIDIDQAFDSLEQQTPRVVLSHQPDAAELSILTRDYAPRVDLMCSGHTHGGQVRIPFIGTPLVPSQYGSKYAGGMVEGPAFPVVVSRGIGMSLLPVRFGVPPEIVVITLTCQ